MNRRPMSESYANSQNQSANKRDQQSLADNQHNQPQQQQQQQQLQSQPQPQQTSSDTPGQLPQLMCATELTNLLLEFAFSVFVNKPEDIVDYAAKYFNQLSNQRPTGPKIDPTGDLQQQLLQQQQQQQLQRSSSNSKRPSADSHSSGNEDTNNNNNMRNVQLISSYEQGSDNQDDDSDNQLASNRENFNQVQQPKLTFSRRKSVFAEHYDPANDVEEDDTCRVVHGKTDEQRQRLTKSIKSIFIFRSVDPQDVANILDAMFEVKVKAGEVVIRQGDDGDNFYVVERGKFQIYVTLDDGSHQIRGQYEDNGSFGELALMYNQPRAASVVALTDGSLWAMDRNTFRRIVLKSAFKKRKEYEALFEKVSVLQCLNGYERMNLCDALESRRFANGECIINQGDQANGMYFIESGQVKIVKKLDDGRRLDVAILGKGDYFGELALINHKPRAASVFAMGEDVKLAFLDVKAFERLLGSCIERMEKNCAMYLSELTQTEAKQNV